MQQPCLMGAGGSLMAWLVVVSAGVAVATDAECIKQEAFSSITQLYLCNGAPNWMLVPALWTPVVLNVTCPSSTYHIYTAATLDELEEAVEADRGLRWCGMAHLSNPKSCVFQVSPFGDTYVGIKLHNPLSLLGELVPLAGGSEQHCIFSARRDLSPWLLAAGLLGSATFLNAASLTTSTTFRLSAGSLLFTTGAAVLVAFIIMRAVPRKSSLMAAVAVSASSALAALRFAAGIWAPSLWGALQSRWFIYYLGFTALLGLAITYWMDDPDNVKLNTTVRVALQLAGLMLVYNSTTSEAASLALLAALLGVKLLAPLVRHLPLPQLPNMLPLLQLRWWRSTHWAACAAGSTGVGASPSHPARGGAPHQGKWGEERGEPRFAPGAPQLGRGLGAGRAAATAAGCSGGEADWRTPALGAGSGGGSGGHTQRGRAEGHQRPGDAHYLGEQGGVDSTPWLAGWAGFQAQQRQPLPLPQPQRPPARAAAPPRSPPRSSPLPASPPWHLKTPPPPPPGACDSDSGGEAGGPGRSPWTHERVSRDITADSARGGRGAGGSAPRSGGGGGAAAGRDGGGGERISPLVRMGKIFNPESSRVIQLHKGTYNQMLAKGYVPDFESGVLLPPGSGGGGGDGGAAYGAVSSGDEGGGSALRSGRRRSGTRSSAARARPLS